MKDLVVGATGHLGGLIAHGLLQRGESVRILTRGESDVAALEAAGAERAPGDLKHPASLESACQGVQRIVATATAVMRGGDDTIDSVDRQGYASLIRAAESAGVEQMLFVSGHGFNELASSPLARAKAATEARLVASRLNHTILRPVLFMEAWIAYILGSQLESGNEVAVIGDPDREYGFVSAPDVGRLAVACVGHDDAQGAVLPFGTEVANFRQIVGMMEEATGREIVIATIEPWTPIPQLPPAINDLWSWLATGDVTAIATPETAAAYGIEPVGCREFVKQVFASG